VRTCNDEKPCAVHAAFPARENCGVMGADDVQSMLDIANDAHGLTIDTAGAAAALARYVRVLAPVVLGTMPKEDEIALAVRVKKSVVATRSTEQLARAVALALEPQLAAIAGVPVQGLGRCPCCAVDSVRLVAVVSNDGSAWEAEGCLQCGRSWWNDPPKLPGQIPEGVTTLKYSAWMEQKNSAGVERVQKPEGASS